MPSAPHYPLFLNLDQAPVLVVGGGAVGLRKVKGLLECAARVTVVSPEIRAGFEKITDIERILAPYAATHMARKMWRLVFAATNVAEVNATVQKHARAAGILCCRADEPDDGDFTSGANARVGGITLAVATAGASPVLAARICREAAGNIDLILPKLAELLAEWRPIIKKTLPDTHTRRILLQRLAGEELEAILRKDGPAAAKQAFTRWLAEAKQTPAGLPPMPLPPFAKAGRVLKNAN